MLSREERLEFCTVCQLRKFDLNKGIVCSLTNEHAEFEEKCSHFILDKLADKIEQREKREKQESAHYLDTLGLNNFGIKSGILAGIIYILLGFITLYVYENLGVMIIPIYFIIMPYALILAGFITSIKGLVKWMKRPKNSGSGDEILDDQAKAR